MSIIKRYVSIFTRIYITLIAGLFLTITVFVIVSSRFFFTSESEHFLNDARIFSHKYILDDSKTSLSNKSSIYNELKKAGKASLYIFDFEIINNEKNLNPCENCMFIREIDSIPIFLKDNGLYVAVFKKIGNDKLLVISENRDYFSPEVEWYQDSEILFVITLLFSVSIYLAIIVYLPIRKLDFYLKRLLATYQKFGQGMINTRADEAVPVPISTLAISFNQMADEIEDRIKQTRIFSQAISHELRTPLSRIQLTCDLARRSMADSQMYLFDDIDSYIEDIDKLTTSIIAVAKLSSSECTSQQLDMERLNLIDFIRLRLSSMSPEKIKLFPNFCGDINVITEKTLARLVIDNILINADKYTSSYVWISLEQHNNNLLIKIDDDGPGIPIDLRKEIFLPFFRVDASRNSNSGGFGLGLTIASNAAKLLGWEINVNNSPCGGAQFIIEIPSIYNDANSIN